MQQPKVDPLEEARFLWKLFDLNKSEGAGMEAWDGDELVKRHGGVVKKLGDYRYCFSDFIVGSKPDAGGSVSVKSGKRNRRAG